MASGDGYKILSNPDEFYRLYTSGEFMGIRLEIAGNTLSAAEVMERLKVVRSRRSDAAGRECYYAYSPLTGAASKRITRLVVQPSAPSAASSKRAPAATVATRRAEWTDLPMLPARRNVPERTS